MTTNYCPAETWVSSPSGILASQNVPGGYQNNRTCIWHLEKSGKYLFVNYTKFSLEFGFDFLTIVDITNPLHTLVSHTGSVVPPSEEFEILGTQALVVFSADEYVTSTGFSLQFSWGNCPSECDDHGSCQNGVCVCQSPWSGPTCNIGVCANNCSFPQGECVKQTQCQCQPGASGFDCSRPFCDGTQRLVSDSGTISDQIMEGSYLNNQRCSWIIQSTTSEKTSISLMFDSFATELGEDYVSVYDGDITNSESTPALLIGKYSGFVVPPTTTAQSGIMSVVWETDYSNVLSGWSARFDASSCPNNCSGNGTCILGDCQCDLGKSGENCSENVCVFNCSSHGVCREQVCVCEDGYSGDICSQCSDPQLCDHEYCAPYTRLLSVNGTISSQTEYLYAPETTCLWLIDLSSFAFDGILIQFELFDLNPNYAKLVIYDRPGGQVLRVLTGSISSPTVRVPTKTAYLEFSNNSTRNLRRGFQAYYEGYSCPNSCSGNGDCLFGDCLCHLGWNGTNCSQRVCAQDCNSGFCGPDNTCICPEGTFGVACESHFCTGTEVIIKNSGTISDHDHGLSDQYLPNSNCTFIIRPQNHAPTGMTYVFTYIQIESRDDWVEVVDGPDSGIEVDGSIAPPPITTLSSHLLVNFVSDSQDQWGGFSLYWSANNLCPQSCGGHGACIQGQCYCDGDRDGESCSTVVTPLQISVRFFTLTDKVLQWRWKIYKYGPATQYTRANLYLTSNMPSLDTMVYIFGKRGAPPTFNDFELWTPYAYLQTQNLGVPISEGDVWYFGVYGLVGDTNFTLRLTDDSNGYISSTGTTPDNSNPENATNSQIFWGAFIVFLLVAIFTVSVLIVFGMKSVNKHSGEGIQMEPIPTSSAAQRTDSESVDSSVSPAPVQTRAGYAQFDIGNDYKD